MKVLIFALTLTFLNISVASEKLGTDFHRLIRYKWNLSAFFDTTRLGNTLISGRCFRENLQKSIGAAIIFDQRFQDGGPLGDSNDLVSFGYILTTDQYAGTYDNETYATTIDSIRDSLMEVIVSTEVNLGNYQIRYNGNDGYYYALKVDMRNGVQAFTDACYFFKNNN